MSVNVSLGTIAVERKRRLQSRDNQGSEAEQVLVQALSTANAAVLATRAKMAYEFAKSLEYGHPGLGASSYLAHPVRVADSMIALAKPLVEDGVVLALLHNVFEHTTVSHETISQRFGVQIAEAIRILTVDRTPTDPDYTFRYYQRLERAPLWVRQVKVLDKFDNLFLLGLNPSAAIRAAYLADIEHYVVPMAQEVLPDLVLYIGSLIDDCRDIGYLQEA